MSKASTTSFRNKAAVPEMMEKGAGLAPFFVAPLKFHSFCDTVET
jgi:hypothetical protein